MEGERDRRTEGSQKRGTVGTVGTDAGDTKGRAGQCSLYHLAPAEGVTGAGGDSRRPSFIATSADPRVLRLDCQELAPNPTPKRPPTLNQQYRNGEYVADSRS